ncbi:MAG: mechanosensitive ion channel [Patulibacter sp.]
MLQFAGQRMLGATEASKVAIDVGQWISAALTLILTFALLLAVRWAVARRDPARLASDPGVRTRVRLLQRLAATLIALIGIAAALAQLGVLGGIANTVLATSAITAIIVGFAARATLANTLAGLVLTITQPMRVGDHVRIGDHEGVVVDVTLSATTLRTVLGTTIRLPNELVTQSVVYNDTIDGHGVTPQASVLLPYGAALDRAITTALALPGVQTARISAVESDGWNRLQVRGESCAPGDRVPSEARLRLALLEALRQAGMLHATPAAAEAAGEAGQEPPPAA